MIGGKNGEKIMAKTKTKTIRGFSANPPKNSFDLGFVIYYDGMEGGVERATNYMKTLKESGYKIKITNTEGDSK